MSSTAITLSDLRFGWQRRGPLTLDIPTLTVERGERVFIRGASGSGKSTLLNLIGGVMPPQGGRIEILGQSLDALGGPGRDRFRADHIGFVFQMFNLIPYLSVLENVVLPCRFSRRRWRQAGNPRDKAAELLERLGLPASLHHRRATDLSVGQQQRVAAARALIGDPELVIADEPTSALDTDSRDAFLDLILAQCRAQGSTLLFVSHDPTLRDHFDRAIDLSAINRVGARDQQDPTEKEGEAP